ncbi:MAG: DUF3052 domain-containing protein [Mycobacteriaceae bacterium]
MVAAGDSRNDAEKLGITHGMVVQELGWDDDVDDELRASVEQVSGAEMVDEDSDEVVDVVLLWWRDGDGDLVDFLVDAITLLAEDGSVWVLSPKTGKSGHVEPSEVAEAAPTAGLTQTSTMNLRDWTANRLVPPKARAKR